MCASAAALRFQSDELDLKADVPHLQEFQKRIMDAFPDINKADGLDKTSYQSHHQPALVYVVRGIVISLPDNSKGMMHAYITCTCTPVHALCQGGY